MLETRLRVRAAGIEEALDGLLPALPGGVHVSEAGDEAEIAVLAHPGSPVEEELRRLAGPGLVSAESVEVSDDWRARRLERYEPLTVADRFLIRPDWAPVTEGADLIEIVLGPSAAFGSGVHPTTRGCLAALAESGRSGPLADYGCGSGVLSIGAAKLGFEPVLALDVDPVAVAAAAANAELNGVTIEPHRVDLAGEPPPAAATAVANVPPPVQLALAAGLREPPELAIVSGFCPEDVEDVAAAWARHGLATRAEERIMEWSVLVLG